jgi:L-ascorbate metabolism protein UlaG (beta-lactamase superfamily)
MMRTRLLCACLMMLSALMLPAPGLCHEQDVIETRDGDLVITFIGHASLVFSYAGLTIHVDPFGRVADYSELAEADIILVTHDHMDHLDKEAIGEIVKDGTVMVITRGCREKGVDGIVMENGDTTTVRGIEIVAVSAYNIEHKRGNGQPFHPKGQGNGYIVNFSGTRVYVAGDTEIIPEMEDIAGVDIAFLPMNLPYTMTPEMTAEAAKLLEPVILYPYHYGDTDTAKLIELLGDSPGIEVRVRKM